MNFAACIIEGREDKRLAKQAVIQLVLRDFIVAVHADLQSGREDLAHADVVIVGALGLDRIIQHDGGLGRRCR